VPLVEAKLRIAPKNILFPTDFSQWSAAALPYAAAIARKYDAAERRKCHCGRELGQTTAKVDLS
jgi:hypothetical protein